MDKIDGPYYFFTAIQKAARGAARVGAARRRRSSAARTSCRSTTSPTRWTTSPTSPGSTARRSTSPPRACSARARCSTPSRGPRTRRSSALRVDKRLTDALPKGVFSMLMKLPALKDVRKTLLADFGIPDEVIEHVGFRAQFDTRDTERALAGSGIEVPELDDVRLAALGLLGAPPRPRPLPRPLVRGRDQRARRSSSPAPRSGIGLAGRAQDRRRGRDPDPRGALAGQARGRQGRDRGGRRHGLRLLRRPLRPRRDRRARRARSSPTTSRSTCSSTTPGARSAGRSSLSLRPLPRLRAHDAAQLLRRDQARHGLAAAHGRSAARATS